MYQTRGRLPRAYVVLGEEEQPPRRTWPLVTYTIIIVNIISYVFGHIRLVTYELLKTDFGLIPSQIMSGQNLYTLITSMFIHASFYDAGFWGLILFGFHMLFLWLFGDDAENVFGHSLFLALYLFSGVIGGLFHSALSVLVLSPATDIPMIGASGAVFGVMSAYAFFFPRRRLRLFFIFRYYRWRRYRYRPYDRNRHVIPLGLPAYVFIASAVAIEAILSLALFSAGTFYTDIYHLLAGMLAIGGFIGGAIFALFFKAAGRGPWRGDGEPSNNHQNYEEE
ncbi:MAG: rhomboid family intramembrane serine protease [Promethearchaeota archaeon]